MIIRESVRRIPACLLAFPSPSQLDPASMNSFFFSAFVVFVVRLSYLALLPFLLSFSLSFSPMLSSVSALLFVFLIAVINHLLLLFCYFRPLFLLYCSSSVVLPLFLILSHSSSMIHPLSFLLSFLFLFSSSVHPPILSPVIPIPLFFLLCSSS